MNRRVGVALGAGHGEPHVMDSIVRQLGELDVSGTNRFIRQDAAGKNEDKVQLDLSQPQ